MSDKDRTSDLQEQQACIDILKCYDQQMMQDDSNSTVHEDHKRTMQKSSLDDTAN